jgi:mono/diheme cytochrome c family protein
VRFLNWLSMRLIMTVGSLWLVLLLAGCAHGSHYARVPDADPGRTRFETYCAGCHLNEGAFMMGEAPPLEGSSWVAGPENRVIRIALHGLRGPIEVRGKAYNQEMPGFGPVLTDADIASLLSYVRRRFGGVNVPISEAAVNLIRSANRGRTDYWTVGELIKEP